jgi:hypothetical protein
MSWLPKLLLGGKFRTGLGGDSFDTVGFGRLFETRSSSLGPDTVP